MTCFSSVVLSCLSFQFFFPLRKRASSHIPGPKRLRSLGMARLGEGDGGIVSWTIQCEGRFLSQLPLKPSSLTKPDSPELPDCCHNRESLCRANQSLHPSPARCHLCFDFCMISSFIDDGLYVRKSLAGHEKKSLPVLPGRQIHKDRFAPSVHTHCASGCKNINMSFFLFFGYNTELYKRWLIWSFQSLEEKVFFWGSANQDLKIPLLC